MNLKRIIGTVALGAAFTGCVTASGGSVALRTKPGTAGSDAVIRLNAPESWYVAGQKSDKIDLRGPDNFSSLSVTVTSASTELDCPALALNAAKAAMKSSGSEPQINAQGDLVEFSQVVRGSTPGPTDRRVFGRALCRQGALAVAVCSVGVEREPLAAECRTALESLAIEGTTPVAPPAATQPEAKPTAPAGQPLEEPQVKENPATAPNPEVQPAPAPGEQAPLPDVQPAPEAQPAAPAAQPAAPAAQPAAPAAQPAAPAAQPAAPAAQPAAPAAQPAAPAAQPAAPQGK